VKWFKHLSKPSRFIRELEAEFGPVGPHVYWRVCELMALHYDEESPGELNLHEGYFYSQFIKIYRKSIVKVLRKCGERYLGTSGKSGVKFVENGKYIYLKIDKFEVLADAYTKKIKTKVRTNSVQTPSKCMDKVRTIEEEEEEEEDIYPPNPPPNGHDPDYILTPDDLILFDQVWEIYPVKIAAVEAKREWKKLFNRELLLPDILADIKKRITGDPQWTKENGRYITSLRRYLDGHRWNDEQKKGSYDYLTEGEEP